MRSRIFVATLAVMIAAAAPTRGQDPRPSAKAIGDKVMCLCGCVAILNQCPHHGCSTHEEVQAAIQKLIDEGKSEPEVFQALVARYGTKVLAAPPAKGFNLAAWVLPGLGLILGLFIVVVVARRLLKPADTPVATQSPSVDSKVLAAMEEEMKTAGLGVRDSGLGASD